MKSTNTIRDTLRCPKCQREFTKARHVVGPVRCPKCHWDGSFHYLTKPEEE